MTQQNIATLQDILDALDRSPDLQRQFHKHLVAVIRSDDDLRQEIRKEILTEELIQLPARFTRLEEDVAQIKQDLEEVKRDVTRIEEDVAQVKQDLEEVKQDVTQIKHDVAQLSGRVTNLEEGQSRMSGQLSHLMGSDYETKAIEQSRRLVRRRLGSERASLVYASGQNSEAFENEILLPAMRQGRIDRRQADQLEEADCIIRCEDEQGNVVCGVVEISMTVQDRDRGRAAERAEIFGLATGLPTLPFVVGQDQEQPALETPEVPFLQFRE